ncbi:hypothetical protein COCNU_04G009030 [Cocos nucifera]|uniref:Uncharacterized protein n=1 Tax=Cocos nucifera TaxID=13894 RepID=A0A8K0I6W7_COCNU|nr:hypothetical protein COCNU_04G009030 [Cocos nucifera]
MLDGLMLPRDEKPLKKRTLKDAILSSSRTAIEVTGDKKRAKEELQMAMKAYEEAKDQSHPERTRVEVAKLKLKEAKDNVESKITLAYKEGKIEIAHVHN